MYTDIEEIILKTRKNFFSKLHGEHTSLFLGSGLEFNEIRQYTIDDDIRHINWKTTAKTKDPSVNIYYENKKLDIVLTYLCSGSMGFGSSISKQDIASILLASISYLAIEEKDNVTTLFFDEEEKEFFKKSHDRYLPHTVFELSHAFKLQNCGIDYTKLSENMVHKIKSRSIIFLVGDFLEIPFLDDLRSKFEVYILIIRHKDEEVLQLKGEYNLIDTNKTKSYHTNISSKTIKKYNHFMVEHDKKLYEYFENLNFRYTKIYTNEDPIKKLENFLKELDRG